MGGTKYYGLTTDSVVLALKSFVCQTGKQLLLSTKNPEDAFDLYNRGVEHDSSVFTYFPDSNNENNVPGFEQEELRHQKESLIKTAGRRGLVCVGTHSSFKEKTIPKQFKTNLQKKCFVLGAKPKGRT